MADTADLAAEITEDVITDAVRRARNAVLAGTAGECEECEWWMPRLVDGRCGFCRDGRPRPPDWEPPPRPDPIAIDTPQETTAMPGKTIELPATAVAAIEAVNQHAAATNLSQGKAAADLIERGIAAAVEAALDQVAAIAAELLDRPDDAAALAAATSRAEAAKNEADSLRELLGETTERATRFATKLDELRAALAA